MRGKPEGCLSLGPLEQAPGLLPGALAPICMWERTDGESAPLELPGDRKRVDTVDGWPYGQGGG